MGASKISGFEASIGVCGLGQFFRPGLRALKHADSQRVSVRDSRKLRGSIDLDTALRDVLPNASRWDYGVCHLRGAGEMVHWIEVHPATAGEVKTVLRKLNWLHEWLAGHAAALNAMTCCHVWISSGPIAISPVAPARRILAQHGLVLKGHRYLIE